MRLIRSIPDELLIRNGSKQGNVSLLLFNLILNYLVRLVKQNEVGLGMRNKIFTLGYADDLNWVEPNDIYVAKNGKFLMEKGKEVRLTVKT